MEPFLGQLLLGAFSIIPRGFLPANGQVLGIQQYTALFALFGTFYGGNGVNNFALPDLRGRVPVHQGNFQGNVFSIGQVGGEESHTITAMETPKHNHAVTANKNANLNDPGGAFLGGNGAAAFNSLANVANMNPGIISNTGASLPHENRQPFLVMNWVVAMSGIFPSRG